MSICTEIYFDLSKDEYSEIKKFINDNIDTFESMLAPMHDFIDLYKRFYDNYCYCACSCHCLKRHSECVCENGKYNRFCEENDIISNIITRSYFNVEYIKFSYLLQKVNKLNISNINNDIIINMFINLYENSNIYFNEKIESKIYDLYQNYVY